jgi:hypothetical protein
VEEWLEALHLTGEGENIFPGCTGYQAVSARPFGKGILKRRKWAGNEKWNKK